MEHIPVLLHEVVEGLNLAKGKCIVDGTLNGGGHAREIITRIMPGGRFLGIDWDNDVLSRTCAELKKEFPEYKNDVVCAHGNYRNVAHIAKEHGCLPFDGILLDLGFSSIQLESSRRGFSFLRDEPLDMRYDSGEGFPAREVVGSYDERSLADVFWKYGEEQFSRRIAKAIVEARRKERIETTGQLARVVESAVPGFYRHRKIHPATKVFQSLRIFVNQELDNLEEFLNTAPSLVKAGGRIAVISFHSLEDRMVKRAFAALAKEHKGTLITKKPMTASGQEAHENPRSRSAKLRVIEII